ncbi:MAG TPA: response regulator [Smithellaceae bacterium]|nr:response regulator [Smithellaceae bacterium]
MIRKAHAEQNQKIQKKILVVDDYLPTRKLIIDTLTTSGNYRVDEAENGQQAVHRFDESDYDLVISDIMMPGMSGMDLLHWIREKNPGAAVIMITGNPTTDLTVSAIKKGAVDFLTKPFDIDELLYKVDIHLRQKEMLSAQSMRDILEQNRIKDTTVELSKRSYIYDAIEDAPMDNDVIFEKIAELSLQLVDGEICAILLYDDASREFHVKAIRASKGDVRDHSMQSAALKMVYNEVIERREAVLVNSNDHPDVSPSLICAPLMIRNAILGILSIRKKKNREVFSKRDLHHILSLTKRASLNLENKILYESIYSSVMDTLSSLISSIQARDCYTEEHSMRVTREAMRLARSMNFPEKDIESLRIAGMLHDIGKIAVPDSILLKPGKLSEEEYLIIKNHPTIGENIVKPIILLEKERRIIQCHHERWDGSGYPHGLKGPDIPVLARILAVADAYDAMTNNRPYRPAMSRERAIEELIQNVNVQFDPDVVNAYIKIL